jgi:hypothetical protein
MTADQERLHLESVAVGPHLAHNREPEPSAPRHASGEVLWVDPSMRQLITRSRTVFA